jgi:DNA polymerase-1
MISDWRELPFREIWVADSEFYPGPGLDNGGREGDPITPLCVVAREMRSGRTVRLWQDELGSVPPYSLDPNAVFMGYMASAELGTHIALGWGQPASCIDPYVEFRHLTNDARLKSGDREKDFYGIGGALKHFRLDPISSAHKKEMRDRIIAGPPFTASERADILDYCESDVDALARLVPHIVPTIRSLSHALMRGKFMWCIAQMESRGVPIDVGWLDRITTRWDDIQMDLVTEMDRPYGVYEIEDGKPHWRSERFEDYLRRSRTAWPRHADGRYDLRAETFNDMSRNNPHVDQLRELRATMAALRANKLQVGRDGRNRTLLGPFGSKTSRNQPSANKYVFGPAKCMRFLIAPPPGLALVHRDYAQQEIQIAAILSGDEALLAACDGGDAYIGMAKQLGFVPEDATKDSHPLVRKQFKTVTLGILYGLGPKTLAARIGVSLSEAAEILARLRARFRVFEAFTATVADYAGLNLAISNSWGWWMQCPAGTKIRTLRNFPVQSCGAEMMRATCILAERRGIRIVAPVHDAFTVEAPVDQIEDVSAQLDQVMRDASRTILRGHEIRTDKQIIRPPDRFQDDRGEKMWNTITKLVAKLEAQVA